MHIGSGISHYKIVEKLGEGGMGVVYKAEDTKLERTVALKFLADHLLSDAEAKERFLREAKAAAALDHPNVCPVHEIDEVDGKTFLAMAFLKGVRPFPNGAGHWQASVDGGSQPRWSRDGKELFYVKDLTLLSVSAATGDRVTLGQPQELFQSDDLRSGIPVPQYDVSADGQRFLTVGPAEQGAEAAPPKIRVVQNWYEEFRNREQ